ncbi:MAG: TlpA family protein disulfide reductase, partial [Ilumatobacter sp.]|nr:TlpA family protein disulfide reductase [Ilumatobacter sp.]
MSLELSGPGASRALIEAALPEHPALLDPTHQMSALFGVVNIPNVIWVDEAGMIVR